MQLLRLKVVLVAFDTDDSALAPLRAAHALAASAAAALHAIHVEPPADVDEGDANAAARPDRAKQARAMLKRAGIGTEDAQLHVVAGHSAHAIRALSDQVRADVIVLGPHRAHAGDPTGPAIGSTALAVVTSSWMPCLIVSRSLTLPLQRVLVPVDLSDTSRGALVVALSWASALRAGSAAREADESAAAPVLLTALNVRRPATSRGAVASTGSSLDDELRQLRGDAGTWAGVEIDDAIVESRNVTSAIADACRNREPDLVVLGTRGLGLDAVGRLGSVAAAVMQQVDAPVLLVPPAVWAEYARSSESVAVQ